MKIEQYVSLIKILEEYGNGSYQVKNYVTRSNLKKEKSCVLSRGHIFSLVPLKLYQDVCLNEILDNF